MTTYTHNTDTTLVATKCPRCGTGRFKGRHCRHCSGRDKIEYYTASGNEPNTTCVSCGKLQYRVQERKLAKCQECKRDDKIERCKRYTKAYRAWSKRTGGNRCEWFEVRRVKRLGL